MYFNNWCSKYYVCFYSINVHRISEDMHERNICRIWIVNNHFIREFHSSILKGGEVISFGFSNTPSEGFNYIFTFGDGTDILNDPSSTLNPYTDPTISHIYNTGGTYSVNMVAWNSLYVSVCSHEISISAAHVPIRDVVLTPSLSDPPIVLPFKDRTIAFSYEMIVNNPEDRLKCLFRHRR
jgi:hypothetical protein